MSNETLMPRYHIHPKHQKEEGIGNLSVRMRLVLHYRLLSFSLFSPVFPFFYPCLLVPCVCWRNTEMTTGPKMACIWERNLKKNIMRFLFFLRFVKRFKMARHMAINKSVLSLVASKCSSGCLWIYTAH